MFIFPVQFPLHEPYFDLTPIKVLHTKTFLHINISNYILYYTGKIKLTASSSFSA